MSQGYCTKSIAFACSYDCNIKHGALLKDKLISLQFQEVLHVDTGSSCLHITLKGRGVSPVVNLSVNEHLMNMGTVIAGEYREETFKV